MLVYCCKEIVKSIFIHDNYYNIHKEKILMPKTKFTKVMLDISRVSGVIQNWCEMNLEGGFDISINENKQQILYTIYNNSDGNKINHL